MSIAHPHVLPTFDPTGALCDRAVRVHLADRDDWFDQDWLKARAICLSGCPVFDACREHALYSHTGTGQLGEPYGIWAGMTPEDRAKERQRRRRAQ